jgi:hypothetical protein
VPRPPERGVSSRDETTSRCAAPGCDESLVESGTGRPARYCSSACRARAHRARHRIEPVTVEVDTGSASSRGRRPEHAFLVRLRRGERSVIVTIGLRREAAEHLAETIAEILA